MDSRKVKVKRTRKYGKGVFAVLPIRKGELVAVFDGEVYEGDFADWTQDLIDHVIQFGEGQWRDSTGLARYINHSCEPNCGIKDFFKIVAMRPIADGEQITWDYEMTERHPWWRLRCMCGSPTCRKIIGNHDNMPVAVRRKYAGYISEWLSGSTVSARLLASTRRHKRALCAEGT